MNTASPDRILRFEGAKNVRDLGGLPAAAGTTTRFGVIYRADGLSRLTAADLDRLAALRLRTIIDLRFNEERARAPDRLPAQDAPRVFHRGFLPQGTHALFNAINLRGAGAAEAATLMCANYARMAFDHTAEFAAVMHHVVAPGGAPHLIHCTSGKDRTGLVVAFLLLAIGVPLDAVIADYELSNGDWQPIDLFAPAARAEAIAAVMAAHADYLRATLTAIEQRCGSFDAYLRDVLGFDAPAQAALAALLLG